MAGQIFFIVVEGIDGSGKSSVARRLVKVLEATLGRNVKLTFEPHDPSCAGLFIRQVLMKKITNIPPRTLALAFAVNRADHCDREIDPFFAQVNGKNRVIVCDRYYLSSLVYQSTSDFGYEDIMLLNSGVRKPDLTLFLTASSKTCYERMRNRGEDKELFEVNLNETREKYFHAIDFLSKCGDKIVSVEADGSMADVFERVKSVLFENSPDWLKVQNDLPFQDFEEVFEPTNLTMKEIAQHVLMAMKGGAESSGDGDNSHRLRTEVQKSIDKLQYNDAATIFLEALTESGYFLHDKLPWTDLDAYELSFNLPLGVTQRGAALLLGQSQRYDSVMTKLLGSQKNLAVGSMSDFLFIFDSNPSHLQVNYYERERVANGPDFSLSPMFNVIGRSELANFIYEKIKRNFFPVDVCCRE
jgi:dTMP kinase